MTRAAFSERKVIETLLSQRAIIPCYRCRIAFIEGDEIEREHVLEIALGGKNTPANCVYSHKACHAIETNGTKATTAGSSKNRIAKQRHRDKPKRKSYWPSGRKIQSREFQKHG